MTRLTRSSLVRREADRPRRWRSCIAGMRIWSSGWRVTSSDTGWSNVLYLEQGITPPEEHDSIVAEYRARTERLHRELAPEALMRL